MLSKRIALLLSYWFASTPLLLLPMATAAPPAGCKPMRLGVAITNPATFRKDAALGIHIQTQDETGKACNAASTYNVTLRVTASSGLLYNSGDGTHAPITIPSGRSDPQSPNDQVRVSLKQNNRLVTGRITIAATTPGLMSGAASLSVPAGSAGAAQVPLIQRAAYRYAPMESASGDNGRIGLSLILGSGNTILDNGQDFATLEVILDKAPARDVTLYFPALSSSTWDGLITIPKGQTDSGKPIHIASTKPGVLTIDRLLNFADGPLYQLDPSSSVEIVFVPPKYALLLFQPQAVVTLGNAATVTVTLMTQDKIPILDPSQWLAAGPAPLSIMKGGNGTFDRVDGMPGVFKFTPNTFGSVSMIFQRGDMATTETLIGGPSNMTPGPAVLQVSFPPTWLILSIVVSLGATALNSTTVKRKDKAKAGIRYVVGGVAGLLLMFALTQLLLPLFHMSIPVNTIGICLVSFAGGWGGGSAIDIFAKAVTGAPTETPEPPSMAHGHSG